MSKLVLSFDFLLFSTVLRITIDVNHLNGKGGKSFEIKITFGHVEMVSWGTFRAKFLKDAFLLEKAVFLKTAELSRRFYAHYIMSL